MIEVHNCLKLFVGLLLCLQGHILYCQQYNFRNYSIEEGLPQSQVYSILEDTNGYLLFGTRGGGLSRFDGINFKNYNSNDGLSSNFINCLIRGTGGQIFIGTDNGLSVSSWKGFTNYDSTKGLYSEKVTALAFDNQNNLWIATDKGLFQLHDDTVVRFGRKLKLPMERFNSLYVDKKGTVWAGSELGIFIFEFNNIDKKWNCQLLSKKNGLPSNSITSVSQDSSGKMWICTYGGGVCTLKDSVFHYYSVKDGLPSNTVYQCNFDSDGNVLFGTAAGACIYNVNSDTFINYTETEGLANNVVTAVYKDSFKNYWFGTSGGGVSKLSNNPFVHYMPIKGIMGSWVYSILEDSSGKTWFGTSEGGVTTYDGKVYKRFSQKDGFTAHKVRCMLQDKVGNIWFGTTADGVYVFNGKTFRHFTLKNGLSSNFINCIAEDKSGHIWLGTAGGGISIVNFTNSKFTVERIKQRNGLAGDRITSICIQNDSCIWASCYGAGLSKILISQSLPTVKILNYKYAITKNIRSLIIRNSGQIFLGTSDKGIGVFDGKVFAQLNGQQELSSNNIYSLVLDNNNNLYCGSENGIDKILLGKNLQIIKVKHFGKPEGFRGIEVIQNAVFKNAEGKLWFGTVKCATLFDPSLELPSPPSRTLITGISLFFEDIMNTPFGGVKEKRFPEKLVLPYDSNHISFEFLGVEQHNPEGVQYRWTLDGFDKNWSPESKRREAVYSNLSPGKYTFRVQSANDDQKWGQIVDYTFVIKPPFWKTWWFYVIAFSLFAFVMVSVMVINISAVKRRGEREKAHLEMQKNLIELEQKALRLQMNPHFLFNCLNSIKGLIAEGNSNDAKIYLTKFSKLMRLMLEHSRQSFISLESEIEYLKNYIELEKLSLQDKLQFVVEVDSGINSSYTQIPPMLIQPFLENSLVHGIAQKEGNRTIKVVFKLENDHLECIISDNGIGRKAASLKSLYKEGNHTSTAIAITQQRLDTINGILGLHGQSIKIEDLYDKDGVGAGTTVKLLIPIKEL